MCRMHKGVARARERGLGHYDTILHLLQFTSFNTDLLYL